MKDLLEGVSGRRVLMADRRKFMKRVDEKFNVMKESLKKVLSEQEKICVTCDVWTCRAQSYLGVTVHFINENFKRESYLLAFKQLNARQTYLYLANKLNEIFTDFGIDISKITHIVTDGGSAFCKMFKEFGDTNGIVLHNNLENEYEDDEIENAADVSLNDSENDPDVLQQLMQNDDGEYFQTEILDFATEPFVEDDDYFGDGVPNAQDRLKLPPQRRCHSHICNLMPQDFEKMLPTNADKAFKQMYNKLHSLWSTTSRSSLAKTITKEVLGCQLTIPVETRWNSKFDSIMKVYKILKPGDNIGQNKINLLIKRLRTELNSAAHLQLIERSDFVVMEKYIKVMEPVACALDILQGEFNCSQGYILPVFVEYKF